MNPCTVCGHRQRRRINDTLAQGASVRTVATRWHLGRMAVQRHRQRHLGIRPKAGTVDTGLGASDALDEFLEPEGLVRRVRDVFRLSRGDVLLREAMLSAIRQELILDAARERPHDD